MCGRFQLAFQFDDIRDVFRFGAAEYDWQPNLNIRPTDKILAITELEPPGADLYRWGLIPFWAKNCKQIYTTFNARAEDIEIKPMFREAFKRRRCLIPASGYYEWRDEGGKRKQPYLFKAKDQPLFAFAGLWEEMNTDAGETVKSCTIITCEPNEVAAAYHNRMPVILPAELRWNWLYEDTPVILKSLLKAYANDLMAEPEPVVL